MRHFLQGTPMNVSYLLLELLQKPIMLTMAGLLINVFEMIVVSNQLITFCGVGGHHQNGIAE
jgi:hypothetical protein